MNKSMKIKANFKVARQSGAVLFVSLVLLLALTIIGLSAANRSNLQERMSANLHIQHLAFNAAQGAISAVVSETFVDASTLLDTVRVTGSLNNLCFDSSGGRVTCGGVFFDGDRRSAITARANITVEEECVSQCPGFSIGVSSGVKCRIFRIDGTGTVGNTTVTSSLWASEITAC